jgi:hypothetical protein
MKTFMVDGPAKSESPVENGGFHIPSGWWCNNHLEKYEFVNGKDYMPTIRNGK